MIHVNKIYNIDCMEFMNLLKKEDTIKIDAIVTSPPYNINKPYSKYNDKREKNEYLLWLQKVANNSLQILKEDGSFFLNVGGRPADYMLPFEIVVSSSELGISYKIQSIG